MTEATSKCAGKAKLEHNPFACCVLLTRSSGTQTRWCPDDLALFASLMTEQKWSEHLSNEDATLRTEHGPILVGTFKGQYFTRKVDEIKWVTATPLFEGAYFLKEEHQSWFFEQTPRFQTGPIIIATNASQYFQEIRWSSSEDRSSRHIIERLIKKSRNMINFSSLVKRQALIMDCNRKQYCCSKCA